MQIRVACACGQEMFAPESLAGRVGRCPKCGAHVAIPGPASAAGPAALPPPAPAAAPPSAGEAATKRCPVCAEEILAEAKKCRHCGEFLDDRPGRPAARARPGGASSRAAIEAQEAGTQALILGILGVVVCGVCAPIAIWRGNESKRQAALARIPAPSGAQAGVILGWIGSVLLVLGLVVAFIQIALIASGTIR